MLNKDDLTHIANIVKAETEPLKQGQAQIKTALETLEAGQEDIREKLEKKAEKADIQDLRADLVKKVKSQESRIENLEDQTGTHNPHKN